MAYFSNGTEGAVFDYQCSICKYGEEDCPIAFVQQEFNYSACNNATAQGILNMLVKNDGTCEMFKAFKKDFSNEISMKNAPSLFDVVFGNEKETI